VLGRNAPIAGDLNSRLTSVDIAPPAMEAFERDHSPVDSEVDFLKESMRRHAIIGRKRTCILKNTGLDNTVEVEERY
jgi:hypothetical protein